MNKFGKALAPIRKTITVHVPPKQAFDVFTREMNRWWPPEYTAFPARGDRHRAQARRPLV